MFSLPCIKYSEFERLRELRNEVSNECERIFPSFLLTQKPPLRKEKNHIASHAVLFIWNLGCHKDVSKTRIHWMGLFCHPLMNLLCYDDGFLVFIVMKWNESIKGLTHSLTWAASGVMQSFVRKQK